MTTSPQPVPLEALLSHAEWVRALARNLLAGDPQGAEDLAQETWLAVVENPPPSAGNLRAWLGTVVRRLAWRSQRTANRRRQRESAVAELRAETDVESAAAAVERAASHRDLVNELMELQEPHRGTLVLRFFEGLGPAEIAQTTGTATNTVRSRLQRGLAQLRQRLEQKHGGREEWRAALLPLARAGTGVELAAVGTVGIGLGAWMMTKTKLIAVAALAAAAGLAGTLYLLQPAPGDATPLPQEGEPAGPSPIAASDPVTVRPPEPSVGQRTRLAEPTPPQPVDRRPQVIDGAGRILTDFPLWRTNVDTPAWQGGDRGWITGLQEAVRIDPDLEQRLRQDPAFATDWFARWRSPEDWRAVVLGEVAPERVLLTDAEGRIPEADEAARAWELRSADPGQMLVARLRDAQGAPVWLALPKVRVEGCVLRPGGEGIDPAFVAARVDLGAVLAAIDRELTPEWTVPLREARTDSQGNYLLRDVPSLRSAPQHTTIRARAKRCSPHPPRPSPPWTSCCHP